MKQSSKPGGDAEEGVGTAFTKRGDGEGVASEADAAEALLLSLLLAACSSSSVMSCRTTLSTNFGGEEEAEEEGEQSLVDSAPPPDSFSPPSSSLSRDPDVLITAWLNITLLFSSAPQLWRTEISVAAAEAVHNCVARSKNAEQMTAAAREGGSGRESDRT